ncbi:glycoside hydrolase family 31 protein [Atractiella rhizophila]|nr:glycoside hydrolase family 31 protein [Atractiella rhizophila]
MLPFLPLLVGGVAAATPNLDACAGYNANVTQSGNSFTAQLNLAEACNAYGEDISSLSLKVVYETDSRIHLTIKDASKDRYEVPESVFPRPSSENPSHMQIRFEYEESPFSFSIVRNSNDEVLFDTKNHSLIFAPQYLRLATNLPDNANVYGLGEHSETFRLPTHNLTRTLWTRDAYGIPNGTNLYSSHPVYYEHRTSGTHGVFLLNSNGMDIKIHDNTLEYNVVGGIFDFYFLAGPSPIDVAQQYAQVVGRPVEAPYWGYGLHQCRYGYHDYLEVAQVVANYSAAGIPLETMWTDIDYMLHRLIFTTDEDYFPKDRLQEIVAKLHANGQQYIQMIDPAIGIRPQLSGTYDRGKAADIFLKESNGTDHIGIVWPGAVVWPDWFNPKTNEFWTNEFAQFYHKDTGIDIDGAWIDMNEPASFCSYPCDDPYQQAKTQQLPPVRQGAAPWRDTELPNWPVVQNTTSRLAKRANANPEYEAALLNPPYNISNAAGVLSDRTAHVDVLNYDGTYQYDTHNLYGAMMSTATREALLNRRPGIRPLVITRSTFAGSGSHTGKWLGDNAATWWHYRNSIAGLLGFASIYQVPIAGSDVCGFGQNTTATLCARWASLGAFYPFYRNHNELGQIPQEFYRWPIVTSSAKNAIDIRYRTLDYFFTQVHTQHLDGTPSIQPLFFAYPNDTNTYGIDLQFLWGDSILISPVTEENATSVTFYLPDEHWYDIKTYQKTVGGGKNHTLDVPLDEIPIHIKGGSVIPLRAESANTTKVLRTKDFELVVAVDKAGKASGSLYIDDGVSIEPDSSYRATYSFEYSNSTSTFKVDVPVTGYKNVIFLGLGSEPSSITVSGGVEQGIKGKWDASSGSFTLPVDSPLEQAFTVKFS